ncbi:DNA polymerase III subunit beta [Peptoniphilus sp. KCTC 25270]|uniref:DNA polymerase III subunit beta n=1 Tax=Peptoniphilus sp. KCTC 25270 TaxID=2897414 RepID=UPI001E50EAFF|nr:DNA polymerase III subunit beta [Peptoniphilus sp. KCTC 25270]MCD1147912.1 DNA polymerase III subunit beta [Peptoniphilus sp. KCTC 25270]
MKFHINQKNLNQLVSVAQKAISNRTNMQILEGIYLEAKNNVLTIKATDTEVSIETKASCMIEEEGAIVINSSLFGEIVRKLPNAMVHIVLEDKKIHIECEQSSFTIMGQNAEEYPLLPEVDSEERFALKGEDLVRAFKQTIIAVSNDDMRLALTGVFMDIKSHQMNFVAVDGYRMAIKTIEKEFPFERSVIIPGRSVNELSKLVKEDQEIPIVIGDNHICMELEDTKFYSKLINGEYFEYGGLIRESHDLSPVVNKKDLQNSLERASLLSGKDRAGLVKMKIEGDQISILSNSEIGNVHEVISAKENDKDLLIAFNARYVLEGIRVIEEEEIVLNFTDSVNPCIIQGIEEKAYLYMALPVRLASE